MWICVIVIIFGICLSVYTGLSTFTRRFQLDIVKEYQNNANRRLSALANAIRLVTFSIYCVVASCQLSFSLLDNIDDVLFFCFAMMRLSIFLFEREIVYLYAACARQSILALHKSNGHRLNSMFSFIFLPGDG